MSPVLPVSPDLADRLLHATMALRCLNDQLEAAIRDRHPRRRLIALASIEARFRLGRLLVESRLERGVE